MRRAATDIAKAGASATFGAFRHSRTRFRYEVVAMAKCETCGNDYVGPPDAMLLNEVLHCCFDITAGIESRDDRIH